MYGRNITQIPNSQTPNSPCQNVRSEGRAFNSPKWCIKGDSQQASSPRTSTFSRPGPHVPRAISEGRLYVGNLPDIAKSEAPFALARFPMYAHVETLELIAIE